MVHPRAIVLRAPGTNCDEETAFAWERELQNQLFDSPDCKEGVSAFFAKRTPEFGRG